MKDMTRRHRDNLAGEHRITDLGQFLLFCLFMGLWLSDMFLDYSNFINDLFPMAVRAPIGILILVVSGYMAVTGMRIVFGKNAQATGVIRKGVFRFVRHPIYLSEILLYLGLLFLNFSLAAAASLIPGAVFLYYVSRYEEGLLLKKYGNEYSQYMAEVGMWFPRLWK
jgi:protein-S-isoprenylcysteine O-methyltransferase Ste14